MSTKLNKKDLLKFYLGIANKKEKQNVFDSKESNHMLESQWMEGYETKSGTDFDKKALFNKISQQINSREVSTIYKISRYIQRYAAIFIIGMMAIGGGLIFGIYTKGQKDSIALLEYRNDTKEIMKLELPDGSKVELNTQSGIKYPKAFTKKNRTLVLNGEAYFEVVKDAKRPFYVETSTITIEVLGTNFNVRAYSDDEIAETTLITGKVKISRINPNTNKSQSVILSPNHMATFLVNQERFILDEIDVEVPTAWKKGALVFNNDTFENVVLKLERWYNVDITISDDLLNKHRLTMSIDVESLEETLSIIKKTLPVDYSKAKGEILIYAKK